MAFTIESLSKETQGQLRDRPDYRWMIEQHLPLLRQSPNVRAEVIPSVVVLQFQGNFYALLLSLGIERRHHWLYLRMNRMTHPMQFGESLGDQVSGGDYPLLHPPMEDIERLRKRFSTVKGR
jgi:hypothetical protein